MKAINWGIIGCGDVTEVKSGPAFNKVPNSKLTAVMRRDTAKVTDYAKRHGVGKSYTDAYALINDEEIDAVYIATPPSSHEEYTIASLKAGKPVYVEKPVSLDAKGCQNMVAASKQYNTKLSVAHYRRFQPKFLKIKQLIAEETIGTVLFADLRFFQSPKAELTAKTAENWRLNPAISGGGLFHDMAPHQLDITYHLFGKPIEVSGISINQSKSTSADDFVTGKLLFENNIAFSGTWAFNVAEKDIIDSCEIYGTRGKISFSFFGYDLNWEVDGKSEKILFETIPHVEQPMIEEVVKYFRGERDNPCSAEEALEVMKVMDIFTKKP